MKYRADIDGIRTLAVLLVLVFHFDLLEIGKAGFVGVDVFFVISGFLITGIIRQDLETGRFHFGDFLYRRVRRLYPALVAVLGLTLLSGWFLFLPYRFEELATQVMWSLLYLINFHFWQSINYFGLHAGSVPLLHMWSLAVEEQFYFFFPLICWGIWTWAPRLLLPAVVCGALVSFALGVVFAPIKPEAAFYLLPTRAWELMMGAILALWVHGQDLKGRWLHIMGPAGLALITTSIVLHGPLTLVPGWSTLLPTIGTVLLLIGGFATTAPVTRFMAHGVMVWIGKISYPLYLVHWPIRILLQEHTIEFTFGWRILGFFLSFLVATAIYYLIETPVRRGLILKSRKVYVGLVIGVSVAMVGISALIMQTEGMPQRYSTQVNEILAFRNDTSNAFENCTETVRMIENTCQLGARNEGREVLVIGDSHAFALAGALDIWLANEERGGALMYQYGCMPVLEAGPKGCQTGMDATLALAEASPSITDIILVSIWRQALPEGGKQFGDRWVPEAEVADVFAGKLLETVDRLQAAGKRVTIVEPLFAATRNVPVTLAANLAFERDWPVHRLLSDYQTTFTPVFSAFDKLMGVQRISLIEPFCTDGTCRVMVDEKPIFMDNNHLAFSQSQIIADILAGHH